MARRDMHIHYDEREGERDHSTRDLKRDIAHDDRRTIC